MAKITCMGFAQKIVLNRLVIMIVVFEDIGGCNAQEPASCKCDEKRKPRDLLPMDLPIKERFLQNTAIFWGKPQPFPIDIQTPIFCCCSKFFRVNIQFLIQWHICPHNLPKAGQTGGQSKKGSLRPIKLLLVQAYEALPLICSLPHPNGQPVCPFFGNVRGRDLVIY